MAKFNKLDVPHQWKDEFTKYPHGYTIFEALCKWVKQVGDMVDNINNWNERLDSFVENFGPELQNEVQNTITKWQNEGLLDGIIESALNTELDNVKTQLADNKQRLNTINTKVDGIDRGYGGTFLTLSELESTYPNGDDKRYVVSQNGEWYFWDGSIWKSGGVFQSTGIGDGQVRKEHTNFIDVSKNLLDKSRVEKGKYMRRDGVTVNSSSHYITDKIYLQSQTQYTMRKGQYHTGAVYDINDSVIEGIGSQTGETPEPFVFTTPENTHYVILSGWVDELENDMIVKGSVYPTEYIPYFTPKLSEEIGLNNRQISEIPIHTNPLSGKTVLFNGDSICNGTINNGGYARIIGESNSMDWYNYGISGATLSRISGRANLVDKIDEMQSSADYVIWQGGINDNSLEIPIGEVTSDYDDDFDKTTVCGALESIFKQSLNKWHGAKIGFIITGKSYSLTSQGSQREQWEKVKEVCKKWSIPYLDLFNEGVISPNISTSFTNKYYKDGDKVHPSELGYLHYWAPKVEAWMKTL